jgi:hypothetical protein
MSFSEACWIVPEKKMPSYLGQRRLGQRRRAPVRPHSHAAVLRILLHNPLPFLLYLIIIIIIIIILSVPITLEYLQENITLPIKLNINS